jgi:hypothetical protein
MGRSVNYLDNAEVVLYFPFEDDKNEAGDYDEDLASIFWDDMVTNLQYEIKAKLPSYEIVNGKWDNSETRIILENSLCIIGIGEYCGLVSLSVAPKYSSYYESQQNLALHHAGQIKGTLEKVLHDLGLTNLRKVGTFSNGEAVFQKT